MCTVNKALEIARGELGVKESPANSNNVKYNTWYYGREVCDGLDGREYPWCMAFVQWVCRQASPTRSLLPCKTASCSALMRSASANGCWHEVDIRPGDVAIYDFQADKRADHCGIVERVEKNSVTAIEGNTSVAGSQSNGGQVCRKVRPYWQIMGVVRPTYEEEVEEMDVSRLSDEQVLALYERIQEVLDKQPLPEQWNAAGELREAVDLGITDGKHPMQLIPRYQAAIMAKRSAK